MNSSRLRKLNRVLDDLRRCSPAESGPLLDQVRASDPELSAVVDAVRELYGLDSRAVEGGPEARGSERREWQSGLCPDVESTRPSIEAEVTGGSSVDNYRILKELGRGGQATVYLAEDTSLGRKVALKVLDGRSVSSQDALDRFEREAMAASRIQHPGICTIYEARIDARTPYIAMQFIDGETLARRIAGARERASSGTAADVVALESPDPSTETASPDPPTERGATGGVDIPESLALVERVARALHAAHEAQVIHRDIKPSNIMVAAGGEPVILDFGLARAEDVDLQTLTRSGDFLGTPAYMSPEQLTCQNIRLSRQTDVWSLGVVLYECLTLRRPFDAPTRDGLYRAILTKDPPDPRTLDPRIPRDLRIVLAAALEKDLDRRYQTALHFAEDLRRIRCNEPITARSPGAWLRFWRWCQRNPSLAASLIGFVLALVMGLAVAWHLVGQRTEALREKTEALNQVTRLADVRVLQELRERESTFSARFPDCLAEMEEWLKAADGLIERLPLHRSTRSRLADSEASDRPSAWQRDVLAALIEGIEDDLTAEARLRKSVEERVSRARSSLGTDSDLSNVWKEAIAAIEAEPKYGGLRITRQEGLIPIGPDPASRLWEFAHPLTGEVPVRDPGTKRITVTGRTCLILVLLPGGRFHMGAQSHDPNLPNFDPSAALSEKPVHEVALSPFFASKYEMTQGQWVRMFAYNPSHFQAEDKPSHEDLLLRPVERISWEECAAACRRIGMALPTETRWEYLCRAGSVTPTYGPLDEVAWNLGIAPPRTDAVGGLLPNAFGLHDTLGNVAEWCADWYASEAYDDAHRETLDPRGPETGDGRVVRGGFWGQNPKEIRASSRSKRNHEFRGPSLGVRPVRDVGMGAASASSEGRTPRVATEADRSGNHESEKGRVPTRRPHATSSAEAVATIERELASEAATVARLEEILRLIAELQPYTEDFPKDRARLQAHRADVTRRIRDLSLRTLLEECQEGVKDEARWARVKVDLPKLVAAAGGMDEDFRKAVQQIQSDLEVRELESVAASARHSAAEFAQDPALALEAHDAAIEAFIAHFRKLATLRPENPLLASYRELVGRSDELVAKLITPEYEAHAQSKDLLDAQVRASGLWMIRPNFEVKEVEGGVSIKATTAKGRAAAEILGIDGWTKPWYDFALDLEFEIVSGKFEIALRYQPGSRLRFARFEAGRDGCVAGRKYQMACRVVGSDLEVIDRGNPTDRSMCGKLQLSESRKGGIGFQLAAGSEVIFRRMTVKVLRPRPE